MKKLGLLIIVVVLALGIIGAGYAAWSQTLNIGATVQTGKLSANFINADQTGGVGSQYATATLSVVGDGTDTLTVVIANGYPGLSVDVPFGVQNTGTIATSETWGTIVKGPSGYEADLTVTGNLPGIISPGDIDNSGKVTITLNDSAVQNGSYSVTIPIIASQYTP